MRKIAEWLTADLDLSAWGYPGRIVELVLEFAYDAAPLALALVVLATMTR